MGLFSSKLDQIETRLKSLIEGRLAGLFPVDQSYNYFADLLVAAMRKGVQVEPNAQPIAPDLYVILAADDQADHLAQNGPLLSGLGNIIDEVGKAVGLVFLQKPVVSVRADPNLPEHEFLVLASIQNAALAQTVEMPNDDPEAPGVQLPQNAFFIVNGVQVIPLEKSVVNVGRRSDNDLVIDDPRVSRKHAQIRVIRGKYVIFDLNSKGGTLVNGQLISQYILHPKDVVSLAGVPMVYGQDDDELAQTRQITVNKTAGNTNPTRDSTL